MNPISFCYHKLRTELYDRCSKCILSERYAEIDKTTGLCRLCTEFKPKTDESYRESQQQEMDGKIRSVINNHPSAQFHAILLFSGGKDSCYMLTRLMDEFPDLRLLCLSVDNTFMSPIAIENINSIVAKLGVAHMWIRTHAVMMQQVFKNALLNRGAMMGVVDMIDGELISDIAKNIAKQYGAPIVFMGLSPEQVETILGINSFETSIDKDDYLPRAETGGMLIEDLCHDRFKSWWWTGSKNTPPQFLFPLYAWRVDEAEIIKQVSASNLISMRKLSPIKTNHQLIIPMAVVDYIRHGYFVYEPELASMVRSGRSHRSSWISIFQYIEIASKTGRLLGPDFDKTLDRLRLTRGDLQIPN